MAAHRVDEQLIDGRYARVEQLGRGGFGVVWRAHDTLLQRDVAIKEVEFPPVLDEQEQASLREKVLREARAAARLSHPSLVTVFDVVDDAGRPFIVMELVQAPTLAALVASEGPLPDKEAARIGEQVLDALSTAHAHGIVHRDVKPANVMVSPNGRVQLGDFGIVSIIDDPKVTSSGQLAGSPSYMAPEQAHNRPAGAATDLWGLGATLYFAVEGAPPFEKEGAIPTLTSVVADDPRPMERATTLAPLLRDLLVKDPADRPLVEEVKRRLAAVATGATEEGQPEPSPSPTLTLEAVPLPAPTRDEGEATVMEPADPAPPAEPVWPAEPVPVAEPVRAVEPVREAVRAVEPVAVAEPDRAVEAVPEAEPPLPVERAGPRDRQRPKATALVVALAALLTVALVGFLVARIDERTPTAGTPPSTSGSNQSTESNEASQSSEESGATEDSGSPGEWVTYDDPVTGFSIAHPRGWTVERNGSLTDFRDPESGAYLRVDYTTSPGPSAEQAWRDLETRFAAENPNYERIRIVSTTFKGFPAAIWEFTYTGRGVPLRAIDLGFVTGPYGFALNFQTRAEDWRGMQDVFEGFKDSFQPPR